jgi:hypothetical protein
MIPSYHLVVAKYKEDIRWTREFDSPSCYIYDKSSPTEIPENKHSNYIYRKNIGREAETFVYHIIKHYDTLPDYLVFVQGDPFGHITFDYPEGLKKGIEGILLENPTSVTPFFIECISEPYDGWPGTRVKEYTDLFFGDGSSQKFPVFFAAGCQYIVPKSKIINKSLSFWYKLYAMILYGYVPHGEKIHYDPSNPFDPDGIDGWTLERLLYRIFENLEA